MYGASAVVIPLRNERDVGHNDGDGGEPAKLEETYCLIYHHRHQGPSLGACIHRIRQGWTCEGDQHDQDREVGHRRR